jgi:hypothetical protein
MKLRQLFESTHHKATAAFCFGRFNPAHQGHAKVWEAVAKAGQHWYIGTNPTTIGPNDPLPFDVKTAWMTAIDPSVKGHIVGEQSVLTLASKIYEELGENATVAYITDHKDWLWSGKILNDYNGKEGAHGFYKFAHPITHVESPRVTSATDLRNAARAGDERTFYHLAGVSPKLQVAGKTYFETVAEACGLHPEKVKRAKKEKAVAEESNSIKYANKVIREMRAQEFMRKNLAEGDVPYAGKGAEELNHVHVQALKNAMSIPDISMNKANGSPYMQYRFGMAMANPDMPRAGAMSGDPLITAYTDADMQKVKDAAKSVGAGAITHLSDGVSNEADGGNTTSPVAKPKKNKYGV